MARKRAGSCRPAARWSRTANALLSACIGAWRPRRRLRTAAWRGGRTGAGQTKYSGSSRQSYSAIKKTETGPFASFLSGFLRRRQGHASLLNVRFRSLPPHRRRAVRRAMDPRGTIAKRRKYDNKINFFIYYEVDGDTSKHHLSASNYGPENEWVLLSPRLSDHLRWRVYTAVS